MKEKKHFFSNSGFTAVLHISLLLNFPRFTPHLIKILQVHSETTEVSSTSLRGAQSAELL